ncbi:MAG: 2-succinyl-6-hydroxy-2,4-cyclohexadiene-1-carboxylate synthase [Candidatus Zixiibacteriota bacterium]|nr:MAG: 2-succinyl-6-hydroxy-2,4-cyclohexadiene-1-carboxylate synthase [candidate division Zixibacteria bacterium]
MKTPNDYNYLETGDKANPPILFLHGFMGSALDWIDIMTALSDDFYCVAVDLPGHGQTKVADDQSFTMEFCARNLEKLSVGLGIAGAGVVGYSMGGRLAFYLAVNHAESFGPMVIESASPGLRTARERNDRRKHDETLARQLMESPLINFIEKWYAQPLFAAIDKTTTAYQQMLARRLLNEPRGLVKSLSLMGTGAQPPLWDKLARIQNDILLIVGRQDTKFSQIAAEVAAQCPAAGVASVEKAGHTAHFENMRAFLALVRRFFENIKRG